MKDAEDEAFEDIDRRQRWWGSGFQAKRAAAANKLQDGKCKLCVDGCAACDARAQPAQEPVALVIDGVLVKSALPEKYTGHLYTTPPQPEQKPVAWAIYDKRGGSKSLHWPENHSPDGDATKFDAVPLYTAPPQPAQEPPSEWAGIKAVLDEYGLQAIDFVADFKAALAQPAQESWREFASDYERGFIDGMQKQAQSSVDKAVNQMAQRKWVGLTDEGIAGLWTSRVSWTNNNFARAIEQALKEKNT